MIVTDKLQRTVEGLVWEIDRLPSTAHLFFLNRMLRIFMRCVVSEDRPVSEWLDEYMCALHEDVERAQHVALIRPGENGERDLFLVSSKDPAAVFQLHVSPDGEMTWRDNPDDDIATVLRQHMQ